MTHDESGVLSGHILWTLTRGDGVAQARRWETPQGYELEVQMWTGQKVDGEEDLSWCQVFIDPQALLDAARAKKAHLQALGWLEDIEGRTQRRGE